MATSRQARAIWNGDLAKGSGAVTGVSSGKFTDLPVSWAARTEAPKGQTSPEELLAAAHATCFVTALAGELAKAGTSPEHLDVRCTITMDEVDGVGHRIVSSSLSARGTAPGADAASFAQAAEAANAGCPFSALIKASATVTLEATLEGGV